VIGPIFHSPRRGPRATPLEASAARRYKNLVIDLAEYALAPFGRWERTPLTVERVDIRVRDLAPAFDGYRIAFFTDPHLSPIVPRWWVERAVERTLELGADLIALGGDFVDDDPHFVSAIGDILRPLRAPDGVVAVLGNHDHYVDAAGVRAQLVAAGVRELFNTSVLLVRGEDRIAIGGVGDLQCDVIDFARTFTAVPAGVPRVVLSHDPDVFGYWPDTVRLDLMLSGHTHGGQAWLPVLGPPFVPSQFGFRYLQGLIRDGQRQLYVSRGVGASGVPVRWKCPPELTLAVLRRPAS
jgi:predicted MPP superfamily phosphohydrolase